ncbi:MAG TPA: hypothetical protein VE912_03145, partial [Bacteroidales bacterium]|nr:hypothetical protein [Bacteroidales bacterium]
KQTLYEPEDRVQIQPFKPDYKNDRYVISELKFKDANGTLFGDQNIHLNENLNSIIGGKSSGKSLLLYSAAKTIDPEQVEKTSKRLGFEGYKFETSYNFEVLWKNGIKDKLLDEDDKNQKIIYIPQLYINYLVERDNKEDLNKLVENILLQDTEFKSFYENTTSEIDELNKNINELLRNYLKTRTKAIDVQQKSKEIGKSSDISNAIKGIQESIKQGQKLSNLNKQEFKNYNQLLNKKSETEEKLSSLKKHKEVLQSVLSEVVDNRDQLLGNTSLDEELNIKGSVDRILDQIAELSAEIIEIREGLSEDYQTLIKNLEERIKALKLDVKIQKLNDEIEKINNDLKPFLKKLAGQKELKKLTNNLELEKKKLTEATSLEKQYQKVLEDYRNLRKRTASLLKKRIEKYESIVSKINNTKNDIGSEILLKCNLEFKQDDFQLYHQTNKAAISREHYFNDLFEGDSLNYKLIPELYSKHLWVKDKRYLKAFGDREFDIPLRQGYTLEEILRGLVEDNFRLDYSVTYKGDELLNMSPGKKGTVLLILFLQISSSEYPILIDQPEDNLDNRTIYDLLCSMIKDKKKERQIIIVSHNANLVVATDSENIIVANQEGQESVGSTSQFQFEYVNGSLENTQTKDDSNPNILHQQGIREHVCDILEGGNEAFKQRERKYSIRL